MLLTDLNRDRDIGANSHFVEIGPFKLVVDCGMHPKRYGLEATPQFDKIDCELDAILLTHCHLDHVGSLPLLARRHPLTPIISSRASTLLGPRMLRNSCNVMKRQREELGIRDYPLFSFEEIERLEYTMTGLPFKQTWELEKNGKRLEVTLFPAGHIAGAAGIQIKYRSRLIFFTGDVLFHEQMTVPAADFPPEPVDTLVLETTRGANPEGDLVTREQEIERLLKLVNATIERGGSILIPVFALGRMQELITVFAQAKREGRLPRAPVYCSGLGLDLVDYFDTIARKIGHLRFRRKVMHELGVEKLREFPKPGNAPRRPGIYLLSSGMMVENTPSYHVAASILGDHRSTIAFVGYCDFETPGGMLLKASQGEHFLFDAIDFETIADAHIDRFFLSGHASRGELKNFAIAKDPRSVVLTHGEETAREWFTNELSRILPEKTIVDPAVGRQHEI